MPGSFEQTCRLLTCCSELQLMAAAFSSLWSSRKACSAHSTVKPEHAFVGLILSWLRPLLQRQRGQLFGDNGDKAVSQMPTTGSGRKQSQGTNPRSAACISEVAERRRVLQIDHEVASLVLTQRCPSSFRVSFVKSNPRKPKRQSQGKSPTSTSPKMKAAALPFFKVRQRNPRWPAKPGLLERAERRQRL
jgi:hypothetical protein